MYSYLQEIILGTVTVNSSFFSNSFFMELCSVGMTAKIRQQANLFSHFLFSPFLSSPLWHQKIVVKVDSCRRNCLMFEYCYSSVKPDPLFLPTAVTSRSPRLTRLPLPLRLLVPRPSGTMKAVRIPPMLLPETTNVCTSTLRPSTAGAFLPGLLVPNPSREREGALLAVVVEQGLLLHRGPAWPPGCARTEALRLPLPAWCYPSLPPPPTFLLLLLLLPHLLHLPRRESSRSFRRRSRRSGINCGRLWPGGLNCRLPWLRRKSTLLLLQ